MAIFPSVPLSSVCSEVLFGSAQPQSSSVNIVITANSHTDFLHFIRVPPFSFFLSAFRVQVSADSTYGLFIISLYFFESRSGICREGFCFCPKQFRKL